MSINVLTKLVSIVIVLSSLLIWLDHDHHAGCTVNCPTDISAQRRWSTAM